jgi:ankyrin repeat protein
MKKLLMFLICLFFAASVSSQNIFWASEHAGLFDIKRMVDNGTSIYTVDDQGENVLFYLAKGTRDIEVLRYFVQMGLDVNSKSLHGQTPLFTAVIYDNAQIFINELISLGVKINEKDMYGRTALMIATFFKKTANVIYLLQKGADKKIRSNDGETAYDYILKYARLQDDHLLASVLK